MKPHNNAITNIAGSAVRLSRKVVALSVLMVLLVVFVAPVAAQTASSAPSWESLMGLVKDIRLPGEKFKSLAVDMQMNLPIPLKLSCFLRYQAPDQFCLQVFDGEDQTPVMIIKDKLALINDPLADDVSLIASAGVSFDFVPQGEQYNANFAFTTPTDGVSKNHVELDFTHLLQRVTANYNIQQLSPEQFLLSGTTEHNSSCSVQINTAAVFPLVKLGMFVDENPLAVLNFSRIEADSEVAAADFAFPLQQLNDSGLKISRSEPQGMVDTMLIVSTVIKAVFARSAIRNPEFREQIEGMIQSSIDWEGIAEKDSQRSTVLRSIFTVPNQD